VSANARHSKENPDWQTPEPDLDAARVALGGVIELDPFSCASAQLRVHATDYFGLDHPDPERRDGFKADWAASTVFENHPGGTTKRAWAKSCYEYVKHHFALLWMGFSVEQVCVLAEPNMEIVPGVQETDQQRWARGCYVPQDFSVCYLRHRIHFIDAKRPDRPDRPGHANFVIGVGTRPELFERAYKPLGQISHGPLADEGQRWRAAVGMLRAGRASTPR
jgi:hypothetical protein